MGEFTAGRGRKRKKEQRKIGKKKTCRCAEVLFTLNIGIRISDRIDRRDTRRSLRTLISCSTVSAYRHYK